MYWLLLHVVCLVAVLACASADQPKERSINGRVLMQTSQIVPTALHHADRIGDFDNNELESLLLAESTDEDEHQAELGTKGCNITTTLEDEDNSKRNAFLATFTLGLAALLPDVLAFATAVLGFKIFGAILLPAVFGPATNVPTGGEENLDSDDELALNDQLFPIMANWTTRVDGTDAADDFGCTALHVAAHNGSVQQILRLLEVRANANACEAWGETPLHMAARAGSTEACDALLMCGADPDAANAGGKTPLVVAAQTGHESICNLLLDQGAGAGGVADDDLPPLLKSFLVQRLLIGTSSAHAASSVLSQH